jgi:hypothetical protein
MESNSYVHFHGSSGGPVSPMCAASGRYVFYV